jgi:hypothetical protein
MIRTAFDSDDLDALMSVAGVSQFLFTYTDLFPANSQYEEYLHEAQKRGSQDVILIDRALGDPTGKATIADVEAGAMTADELPAWFEDRDGIEYLTVYCDQSNLAACEIAYPRPHWRWLADLDGQWYLPGFRALHRPALLQVASAAETGVDCDASLIFNDNWHPAKG